MSGTRFARNVKLEAAFGESSDDLMTPSPREVSRRLLARKEFTPVPHLNVLAAAWIQFMVHDWLSHGKNNADHLHDIPLGEDDDWGGPMTVPATSLAATADGDNGRPAAFTNVETHWWDASQIYGSSDDRIKAVRTVAGQGVLPNGKLVLDDRGLLPVDSPSGVKDLELAGVNANWWIGLSVLHTLFAREHNAVVDRLKVDFPTASGEWLFGKARLVVSALLAKIHTVEWSHGIAPSWPMPMATRGTCSFLGRGRHEDPRRRGYRDPAGRRRAECCGGRYAARSACPRARAVSQPDHRAGRPTDTERPGPVLAKRHGSHRL